MARAFLITCCESVALRESKERSKSTHDLSAEKSANSCSGSVRVSDAKTNAGADVWLWRTIKLSLEARETGAPVGNWHMKCRAPQVDQTRMNGVGMFETQTTWFAPHDTKHPDSLSGNSKDQISFARGLSKGLKGLRGKDFPKFNFKTSTYSYIHIRLAWNTPTYTQIPTSKKTHQTIISDIQIYCSTHNKDPKDLPIF